MKLHLTGEHIPYAFESLTLTFYRAYQSLCCNCPSRTNTGYFDCDSTFQKLKVNVTRNVPICDRLENSWNVVSTFLARILLSINFMCSFQWPFPFNPMFTWANVLILWLEVSAYRVCETITHGLMSRPKPNWRIESLSKHISHSSNRFAHHLTRQNVNLFPLWHAQANGVRLSARVLLAILLRLLKHG